MKKAHIFMSILARDGKAIYKELKRFGLNVTDMGAEQLVYGDIRIEDIGEVVQICAQHGSLKLDFTLG